MWFSAPKTRSTSIHDLMCFRVSCRYISNPATTAKHNLLRVRSTNTPVDVNLNSFTANHDTIQNSLLWLLWIYSQNSNLDLHQPRATVYIVCDPSVYSCSDDSRRSKSKQVACRSMSLQIDASILLFHTQYNVDLSVNPQLMEKIIWKSFAKTSEKVPEIRWAASCLFTSGPLAASLKEQVPVVEDLNLMSWKNGQISMYH